MSQEAPTGLAESESKSECPAQMTEDLTDEPCAESVGDECEQAESENDESSGK